ncbi:MAG: flavodoxin family protein [Candidatus Nealsonbacteria bacterium]|nr:flavodoxin family protein [Candidatus Nealsonbacteria bacterium]
MKTLIIYNSYHHQNTKKVAERMALILEANLTGPEIINPDDVGAINELNIYDLIGFGSGIYLGKHHKNLISLVEKLPQFIGKKAFIFSTCGGDEKEIETNHDRLRKKLQEKEFDIMGEFSCKGWDSFGPLKLMGGINKDRPNEEDLKNAENFAKEIREKHPEFINGHI